jgi:RND superfamily putative drug exporter
VFARLGPWCHDRRWLVLAVWIIAFLASNGVAGSLGENYRQDFSLPGAESSAGFDVLNELNAGQLAGQTGTIVFRAEQGVDDPAVQEAMTALFAKVAEMPGVSSVETPYENPRLVARAEGAAGLIAYANVEFPEDAEFADAADVKDLVQEEAEGIEGVQVELGGFIFGTFEPPSSEVFGIAFAIVILILAFGSVLAMGLPVAVALFGIGIGAAGVILFSHVLQVPDFAPFLGLMIGLGVGIDYALLIVTRYREQLHSGHDVRESVQIAVDTAGRSVVFAGATVVISLLGMLLMGVSFVQGLAVSAAATVAVTVLASVTLLPAFLGFAGLNVERTRWRGLAAAGFLAVMLVGVGLELVPLILGAAALVVVSLVLGSILPAGKREVAHRPPRPRQETLAYRWSRAIQHRPWFSATVAAAVLLLLAVPVLSLRLAFSDESNAADDSTTKRAYDLQVAGFGKGSTGPLILVAEVADGYDFQRLRAVGDVVRRDPGVVFLDNARPNDLADPTVAIWFLQPTGGPQDEETTQLVNRLRDDLLPPLEQELGIDVFVTGITAANTDFADVLARRMPVFFGAVLALSFLLLMVVFRSVLVPLKAVIMNLLSIGAAYGIVVALFQWGWLGDITGVSPGPIEPWAPMMLFAVVFGLSMDYEVFLLSRVREEWHRTGDSHTSVADGLAATAKVITAAAAIMVVVFGCFILEPDRTMKLMGTGLATAILLDATIVRMLLVPATMELLGDRNWWLPRWLDRALPTIDVEGHAVDAPPKVLEPVG